MQLSLAWWNTALSPNARLNRADDEGRALVAAVLRKMLRDSETDFVALGEISAKDLDAIRAQLPECANDFEFCSTADPAGRSHFDTALIWRRDLSVTPGAIVIRPVGGRVFRVAQRFDISLSNEDLQLHCYVSHWPSRLSLLSESDRNLNGTLLRQAIEQHSDARPYLLLGDFNAEPFECAVHEALQSTRDVKLAKASPHLLYNPFWRHMSSYLHEDPGHRFTDVGTVHLSGDPWTRWKTVDQMLFSSSLVSGEHPWQLDELATRVLHVPELRTLVERPTTPFDHLPIVGRLRKV